MVLSTHMLVIEYFYFNSLTFCDQYQFKNIVKLQKFNTFSLHFPTSSLLKIAKLCHKIFRHSALPAPSPQESSKNTFRNN